MKFVYSENLPIELVVTEEMNMNYRFHTHTSHYILCVVLNGCVNLKLKNKEINYYTNESFTIAPYVAHSILLDKKSKLLSLCIGTQLFDEYTSDELVPVVEKILYSFFSKSTFNPVMEMFIKLIRKIYQINRSLDCEFDKYMYDISQDIIKEPESIYSLDILSKTLFISKYYFIRKFKSNMGLTPHQFILQEKIRKAQCLLNSDISVVEVSNILGFYDQSHFNKCFKNMVGISPSDFINSGISVQQ